MKCTSCKGDFSPAKLRGGVCDDCAAPEGNWRFGMLALAAAGAGLTVYTVMTRNEKDSYAGITILVLLTMFAFLRARRRV